MTLLRLALITASSALVLTACASERSGRRADVDVDGGASSADARVPGDSDHDGHPDTSDCTPNDPTIHPLATDSCDGVDTDCDGAVDDDPSVERLRVYFDGDLDGDVKVGVEEPLGCVREHWLAGPVTVDCDDDDARINSHAPETCNGIDDDCDEEVDDADPDRLESSTSPFGVDVDGDGYALSFAMRCEAPTSAHVMLEGTEVDCVPNDPLVHPNQHDDCANATDTNCDGVFSRVYGPNAALFTQAGPADAPVTLGLVTGDTVELCPGTYRVRIVESAASGALGGSVPVTLRGVGASPSDVVLDAAMAGRNVNVAFYGNAPAAPPARAVFENLTFTRGRAADGGCLFAFGGDLTLRDVRFVDCAAESGGALGFVSIEGALVGTGVVFSGATATDWGGAIVFDGRSLALTGGSFADITSPIGTGRAILWTPSQPDGAITLDEVDFSALPADRIAVRLGEFFEPVTVADVATLSCPLQTGCWR